PLAEQGREWILTAVSQLRQEYLATTEGREEFKQLRLPFAVDGGVGSSGVDIAPKLVPYPTSQQDKDRFQEQKNPGCHTRGHPGKQNLQQSYLLLTTDMLMLIGGIGKRESRCRLFFIGDEYGFFDVIPCFLIEGVGYVPKNTIFAAPARHGDETPIVAF